MVAETHIARQQPLAAARWGWLKMVQTQRLLKLLAFLILVSVVASLYFYLANAIDDIHDSTAALTVEAQELERANATLMTQVAAWNRPDAIAARAAAIGLAPGPKPVYAQVAGPNAQGQAAPRPNDVASWWQQLVQDVARRWSGVTRMAVVPANR